MNDKLTLVIGASENEMRYSNMAIRSLLRHGHSVVAIGSRPGNVNGIKFDRTKENFENVDTVTLYVNPTLQKEYYDYIIGLKPRRIIFNPGTENPELYQLAGENEIEVIPACTLVMLNTGQY